MSMKAKEPGIISCLGFCDGGYRGMDRCGKCDGTGSQFAVKDADGCLHVWPNTQAGYVAAFTALNGRKPTRKEAP